LSKKGPKDQSSNASQTGDNPATENPPLPEKINWLKDEDMLPRSLPRARIMQFDYRLALTEVPTAEDNLETIATELLKELSKVRKDCKSSLSRPIIFIGHSFGGIVIEKALIIGELRQYWKGYRRASIPGDPVQWITSRRSSLTDTIAEEK
jgi:hypothetical protein